ncbi:hypothetical protein PF010_g27680 [Phytophthora fragariae]|uniref:Uncharacterized protein n=1 Tax=Phytophthora fragariae TaxID=53985 RepID=A0A6G0JT65_9STRA|nr:hypothetical protein PF010_g27680 [Phytophthora fragariae]
MDHGAGVDVVLGTDFMIPAGVRLDMFYATARLPDEVSIPLIKTLNMQDDRREGPHVNGGPTENLLVPLVRSLVPRKADVVVPPGALHLNCVCGPCAEKGRRRGASRCAEHELLVRSLVPRKADVVVPPGALRLNCVCGRLCPERQTSRCLQVR